MYNASNYWQKLSFCSHATGRVFFSLRLLLQVNCLRKESIRLETHSYFQDFCKAMLGNRVMQNNVITG